MESRAPAEFDLVVLDAFNSDSIPAHLFSREARRLYLSKMKLDGVLLFHDPSRYLQVGDLAVSVAIDEGLIPFVREDYVAAVTRPEYLHDIPHHEQWLLANKPAGIRSWTDDYSDLLNVIRWK